MIRKSGKVFKSLVLCGEDGDTSGFWLPENAENGAITGTLKEWRMGILLAAKLSQTMLHRLSCTFNSSCRKDPYILTANFTVENHKISQIFTDATEPYKVIHKQSPISILFTPRFELHPTPTAFP